MQTEILYEGLAIENINAGDKVTYDAMTGYVTLRRFRPCTHPKEKIVFYLMSDHPTERWRCGECDAQLEPVGFIKRT